MTEHRFVENLINHLKTCPGFAKVICQALHVYMTELAKEEKYEVACKVRDMVNFLKKLAKPEGEASD